MMNWIVVGWVLVWMIVGVIVASFGALVFGIYLRTYYDAKLSYLNKMCEEGDKLMKTASKAKNISGLN